jgi:hypothetical protein
MIYIPELETCPKGEPEGVLHKERSLHVVFLACRSSMYICVFVMINNKMPRWNYLKLVLGFAVCICIICHVISARRMSVLQVAETNGSANVIALPPMIPRDQLAQKHVANSSAGARAGAAHGSPLIASATSQ